MPLHVSDASNRLDLRNLGSELGAVLILSLFKQVLIASVAWILIAHPTGASGAQAGRRDKTVRGHRTGQKKSIMQHFPLEGWTYVPL